MNPNQALWEKGDFTRIAATMRESGEALVESLKITKGLKVLDVGCGTGILTNLIAEHAKRVTAIDHSSASIQFARQQAFNP